MSNLMSINQAAERGINKLRRPNWSIPEDHIVIDIINGQAGPWIKLYSPLHEAILAKENPQTFLGIQYGSYNDEVFEAYHE